MKRLEVGGSCLVSPPHRGTASPQLPVVLQKEHNHLNSLILIGSSLQLIFPLNNSRN